jgi:SH3 domain
MAPPSPRAPPTSSQGNNPGTETLEDGTPILFYGTQPIYALSFHNAELDLVRALYDYVATIDEEFDFQSGDIIAVTATPEDGWWSGVLLDDARRVPNRTVFPSNFVCLF